MAGDWIKMRCDLAEDPAVIRIAEELSLDEDTVVGKLHRLWSWADRQSRDGHAYGVTARWVDKHLACDGFAVALQGVGWMVVDDQGVSLPNFDRHNGEPAKARALGTRRKQKQRATVPPGTGQVSREERDSSGTREEKRRAW